MNDPTAPDSDLALVAVRRPRVPPRRSPRRRPCRPSSRVTASAPWPTPWRAHYEEGGVLLAEAGTGTGQDARLPRARHPERPPRHRLDRHQEPAGADPREGPAAAESGPAAPVQGHGDEGPRQLPLPAPVRGGSSRTGAQRRPRERVALALIEAWLPAHDHRRSRRDRRTAGGRAVLGRTSRPRRRTASATIARSISDCFVTKMRQRAAESDVVIVNHHLLCADAAVRQHSFGSVIPEAPLLVVDEAHQLEDVATQYFGVHGQQLPARGVRARRGSRVPHVRGHRRSETRRPPCARRCRGSSDARALFSSLQWKRPGTATRTTEGGGLFDERLRLTDSLLDVVGESGLLLTDALGTVEATIAAGEGRARRSCRRSARRAGELREAAPVRAACHGSRPSCSSSRSAAAASSCARRPSTSRRSSASTCWSVRTPPCSPPRRCPWAGPSRTRSSASASSTPRNCNCRRSSTTVRKPCCTCRPACPTRVRRSSSHRPRARSWTSCGSRRGGRSCCSRATRTCGTSTRGSPRRCPTRCWCRVTRHAVVLVEQFRSTANAVLLATSSFWQGVDVVGRRAVVRHHRQAAVRVSGRPGGAGAHRGHHARPGGDAFHDYQVPLAILTLLQGLGRLLRHRSDRGVLAVLDPRLRTMGYGRRFLDALPPAPLTHRIEDVQRFFGQGN